MQCRNCGFENIPGQQRCARCQSLVDFVGVDVLPPRRSQRNWARTLRLGLAQRARAAGHAAKRLDPLPVIEEMRGPALRQQRPLRAIDLLVPGMAIRALGWPRAGLALLVAWVACLAGAIVLVGSEWANWLLITACSLHSTSFVALDFGDLARRTKLGQMAVGVGTFLVLLFAIYLPARWLAGSFARVLPVRGIQYNAMISNGDVLLYSGRWARPTTFRRGDLVVYHLDARGTGWVVREGYGVDRIIGLPGEAVRIEDGAISINGVELSTAEGPIGGTASLPNMNLRAGPGEYVILPSALDLRAHGGNAGRMIHDAYSQISVVPAGHVLGRASWRIRPFDRFGSVE